MVDRATTAAVVAGTWSVNWLAAFLEEESSHIVGNRRDNLPAAEVVYSLALLVDTQRYALPHWRIIKKSLKSDSSDSPTVMAATATLIRPMLPVPTTLHHPPHPTKSR